MSITTETSLMWTKCSQTLEASIFESTNSTEDNFQRGHYNDIQVFEPQEFNFDTNFDHELDFNLMQCYPQSEKFNCQEERDLSADYIFCSNFTTDAASSLFASSSSEETSVSKQSKKIKKESKQKSAKNNKQESKASKRDFWQSEEDALVLELYAVHGPKWAKLASIMENRTRKQIRDRYMNALRPDINNNEWTQEEEKMLVALHEEFGNKWALIASHMKGRTENQVKNKYYWSQKKQTSTSTSPIMSIEFNLESPKFSEIPRSFETNLFGQAFDDLNMYFSEDISSRGSDRTYQDSFDNVNIMTA